MTEEAMSRVGSVEIPRLRDVRPRRPIRAASWNSAAMRLGIISDVHGNRYALESVLRTLDDAGIDRLVCLGDVVGYGPDPEACLDLILERDPVMVLGNHEEALLDPTVAVGFREVAREAIDWTRRRLRTLRPDLMERLGRVPGMAYIGSAVMCVHDSPIPGGARYLVDDAKALPAFQGVDVPICLIGHTHLPAGFRLRDDASGPWVETLRRGAMRTIGIDATQRWILNPGSVGQPRDGDPRASFAVLDLAEGVMSWERIAYDVDAAQSRALASGLPARTAERLALGA
jgi:predicted phosphodiesterase